MDLGAVTPGYHEGEATTIWRLPIECYAKGGKQLKVVNVYADEGVLVIDVELPATLED